MVQADAFSPGFHYDQLLDTAPGAAVATFAGYVRDFSDAGQVDTLTLEHYPGMAERVLTELGHNVAARFGLRGWRIVHRYGAIAAGEIIVWVGTVADHRSEALAACECIMDTLKTDAPFWKCEQGGEHQQWVEARQVDVQRRARWS